MSTKLLLSEGKIEMGGDETTTHFPILFLPDQRALRAITITNHEHDSAVDTILVL